MRRVAGWAAIFILGMLIGRVTDQPLSAASSQDELNLREVTMRQDALLESARLRYEAYPNDFLAASRLALLLSCQRENHERLEREFGTRLPEPVYSPELEVLLQECRRLARTEVQRDLVDGLKARISRQNLRERSASGLSSRN